MPPVTRCLLQEEAERELEEVEDLLEYYLQVRACLCCCETVQRAFWFGACSRAGGPLENTICRLAAVRSWVGQGSAKEDVGCTTALWGVAPR